MTSTKYVDEIKTNVLFQLANEVLNTQDLAEKIGVPYPTMRRIIVEMVNEGTIIQFDRQYRNARYSLAPDDSSGPTPKKYVPNIVFKGKTLSLLDIYLNQGIEAVAVNSANAILQAWTTVAVTARRLHEGMPDAALVKRVNRERVALSQARTNLEQLVFICNQLLNNEKLWDPVYLANFPEDADWPEFLPHLEELYSHYFGADNNG